MKIDVMDDKQLVNVWLTTAEKDDPAVKEELRALYSKCNEKNYFVAVFKSGEKDLADMTSDLICHNRNIL